MGELDGPSWPPTAYKTPSTTPTAKSRRAVGIGALFVQVLLAGSYATTVLSRLAQSLFPQPPTAYRIPLTTPTASRSCALGSAALFVHVSLTGSYASTTESGPPEASPPPTA